MDKQMHTWAEAVSSVVTSTEPNQFRGVSQEENMFPSDLRSLIRAECRKHSEEVSDLFRHELGIVHKRVLALESKTSEAGFLRQELEQTLERIGERKLKESDKIYKQLQDTVSVYDLKRSEQKLKQNHLHQINQIELQVNDLQQEQKNFKIDALKQLEHTVKFNLQKLATVDDMKGMYDNFLEETNRRFEAYSYILQEAIDSLTQDAFDSYKSLYQDVKKLEEHMSKPSDGIVKQLLEKNKENFGALETQVETLISKVNKTEVLAGQFEPMYDSLVDKIGDLEQKVYSLETNLNTTEKSNEGLMTFGDDDEPVTEVLVDETDLNDMIEGVIQEFVSEEMDIGGQLVEAILQRNK